MEISSKKLERSSKLIYFSISLILCVFLILLTNRIIGDIDNLTRYPAIESFENKEITDKYEKEADKLDESVKVLEDKRSRIEKTILAVKSSREKEKESFDNWIQTRTTIGSPSNDKEVLQRAQKLDELLQIEKDWQLQESIMNDSIKAVDQQKKLITEKIYTERTKAEELFQKAVKKYDLKVFLIRLLLVTPVLLLGIWFFVRLRKNKYWPLFRGFTLFSLYAFFIGLVPYLPSYGGYIRYSAGIILSIFAGYYAINRIRKYLEQKKLELKVSSDERSRKVQSDTAEKALQNHVCPSCGKDFALKNWELPADSPKSTIVATDFCRYCGLELFAKCTRCETRNYVHLPYCIKCGEKTKA